MHGRVCVYAVAVLDSGSSLFHRLELLCNSKYSKLNCLLRVCQPQQMELYATKDVLSIHEKPTIRERQKRIE